jgi:hypothetical protein
MMPLIDFHTHMFPIPKLPETIERGRTVLRQALRPLSWMQHELHSRIHDMPNFVLQMADEIGTPSVAPHLLIESSPLDLQAEMKRNGVVRAVAVPHPPMISNNFVYYECRRFSNLTPCTFLDPETIKTVDDLKSFWDRGVRIFKANPIQTGVVATSHYYLPLLEFINEKKAILILHTGDIKSHLFFKKPNAGHVEVYKDWFREFSDINFLLAHMNFHHAKDAILMAKEFENINLIPSWQSADSIFNAVKTIGASRLLFGSDWPLVGDNIGIQRDRIWKLSQQKQLSVDDVEKIFFTNANQLLLAQGITALP